MKIKVGQLFTREIAGSTEANTYLVCGIIKTDESLETERTHIFTADMVNVLETNDVKHIARGNSLDGLMHERIWKIKI